MLLEAMFFLDIALPKFGDKLTFGRGPSVHEWQPQECRKYSDGTEEKVDTEEDKSIRLKNQYVPSSSVSAM